MTRAGTGVAGWRDTDRGMAPQPPRGAGTPARRSIDERRRARVFRNVNLAQWRAIAAMIALLKVLGHVEWITPAIMFIVGIHFIPLAFLYENKAHLITGPALALLAIIYPLGEPPRSGEFFRPDGRGRHLAERCIPYAHQEPSPAPCLKGARLQADRGRHAFNPGAACAIVASHWQICAPASRAFRVARHKGWL